MKDDLEILELESDFSWPEVQQAYHDQIKVWHPDRFQQDPRLQTRAKKKTQEINIAYERLKFAQQQSKAEQDAMRKARKHQKEAAARYGSEVPDYCNGRMSSFSLHSLSSMSNPLADLQRCTSAMRKVAMFGMVAILSAVLSLVLIGVPVPNFDFSLGATSPKFRSISAAANFDLTPTLGTSKPRSSSAQVRDSKFEQLGNSFEETLSRRGVITLRPSLIEAAINCDVRRARKALKNGSKINVVDSKGETALIWAAKRNCAPVAKLLVANGANLYARSSNGFTPIGWASWYKNSAVEEVLKSYRR